MIMVGMPTYDGKMHWTTVSGLIGLGHICAKHDVGFSMDVIPHDAFVGHSRNLLAHRFLKSGFHDLLFVDADIGFEPMDAVKLCRAEPDIVFGIYRIKKDRLVYPARFEEPTVVHPSDPNLLKMHWGPTGFMRIRASIFLKMIERWPDEWYTDGGTGEKVYDFFPGGRHGNNFASEDVAFCEKLRQLGIDVWAMQGLSLEHTGAKTWQSRWEMVKGEIVEAEHADGQ